MIIFYSILSAVVITLTLSYFITIYKFRKHYDNDNSFFYFDYFFGITSCIVTTKQVVIDNRTTSFNMKCYAIVNNKPSYSSTLGYSESVAELNRIKSSIKNLDGKAKFKAYTKSILKYVNYDSKLTDLPMTKDMVLNFSSNKRLQLQNSVHNWKLLKSEEEVISEIVVISKCDIRKDVIFALQTNNLINHGIRLCSGYYNETEQCYYITDNLTNTDIKLISCN